MIFVENDTSAIFMMKGLRDAGLNVPQDIAVIGYNDTMFRRYTNPTLATIGFDKQMFIGKAVELLINMISTGKQTHEHITVPTYFIGGESLG